MLAYFDVHLGWTELFKRTFRDTLKDDAQGLAAQLSYYFFLSLFPTLLCLIALASLFPLQNFVDDVTRFLQPFMPGEAINVIRDQMVKIAQSGATGLISVGVLGAIWSSSAAMGAVVNAMNRAYDIEESRPWWRVKVLAVLLTIGLAFFILIALTLVLAGPQLADLATRWVGVPAVWALIWKIIQWPLVFFLVATGIGLIYYFAPDAEQEWVWITPGSVLATILWLIASLGFRYYVVTFGHYSETYGALGGIIVVLLWFYLSSLAIVIGAELNAEIEHASPWGRKPREKQPGGRKRIGRAAAREYELRRRIA
ncbi:MAG: YihY/virulence factor BrkB family protein [Acidobacteriota bacterium]